MMVRQETIAGIEGMMKNNKRIQKNARRTSGEREKREKPAGGSDPASGAFARFSELMNHDDDVALLGCASLPFAECVLVAAGNGSRVDGGGV
ncbi:hypothetical protein HPB50_018233 [Hyalomma asiaticum]|uniref:Uncharacterized protein n=1 Tax=Hyalomma asiaticum TaxID=266040 RepID=A0ACB7SR14_HYAAI|nr:hypothetical protein HPB50_018233 [Hyalomma asiaticum]